jgi:hypothetical protein
VRVDDAELAELDAMRNGVSRAAFVRSLIRKPPEVKDVASYEEALAILTAMARDGKVAGAIALQRALHDPPQAHVKDELDEILRGRGAP